MSSKQNLRPLTLLGLIFMATPLTAIRAQIPALAPRQQVTQLIVDGSPFLILGGELGNSSASSLAYMQPIGPKIKQMNLNTLLAPVYWDRIEPREGVFDFTLVDGLIRQARDADLRLILLWFASWKNSMSCYAPEWIKTDFHRYPRAYLKNGQPMEILSAFSPQNRDADTRAFAALMRHLRQTDSDRHTVIMVQVENEVGMLIDARDHSPAANEAFAQPVPQKLIDYLKSNKVSLVPELRDLWKKKGFKTSGTWQQVFGKGLAADEIFMAWHYARYIEAVAAAGKAEHPLPMFVNAALIRPGHKPGQYPSAGPLPHLMDIWRAAAPSIDFLAPDIYFPNFAHWCAKYHQTGNPLFIPEAKLTPDAAAHAFYAIGQHNAMGFSPFSIESLEDPENAPLTQSYAILSRIAPLIFQYQPAGRTAGVLLDKDTRTRTIELGDYILTVSHDYTWGWSGGDPSADSWPRAGAILIATDPDQYTIAGTGIIVTFAPRQNGARAGILSISEGTYLDGQWTPGRWLSGDQSHQGRHLRIPAAQFGIQKIKLYSYR